MSIELSHRDSGCSTPVMLYLQCRRWLSKEGMLKQCHFKLVNFSLISKIFKVIGVVHQSCSTCNVGGCFQRQITPLQTSSISLSLTKYSRYIVGAAHHSCSICNVGCFQEQDYSNYANSISLSLTRISS